MYFLENSSWLVELLITKLKSLWASSSAYLYMLNSRMRSLPEIYCYVIFLDDISSYTYIIHFFAIY